MKSAPAGFPAASFSAAASFFLRMSCEPACIFVRSRRPAFSAVSFSRRASRSFRWLLVPSVAVGDPSVVRDANFRATRGLPRVAFVPPVLTLDLVMALALPCKDVRISGAAVSSAPSPFPCFTLSLSSQIKFSSCAVRTMFEPLGGVGMLQTVQEWFAFCQSQSARARVCVANRAAQASARQGFVLQTEACRYSVLLYKGGGVYYPS